MICSDYLFEIIFNSLTCNEVTHNKKEEDIYSFICLKTYLESQKLEYHEKLAERSIIVTVGSYKEWEFNIIVHKKKELNMKLNSKAFFVIDTRFCNLSRQKFRILDRKRNSYTEITTILIKNSLKAQIQ